MPITVTPTYNKLTTTNQARIAKAYNSKQHVYFARTKKLKMVKIGIAQEPPNRVKDLQIGNPLEIDLIYVIPFGGKVIEEKLHEYFSQLHVRGEWYHYKQDIKDFIKQAKTIAREEGIRWNIKTQKVWTRK